MVTIEDLYQQMADLTRPECAQCRIPYGCCDAMYCEEAIQYARERGEPLQRTDHPKLPLMGPDGCIAAPHLRPSCTLHLCDARLYRSVSFLERYMDLRRRLSDAGCVGMRDEDDLPEVDA